MDAREYILCHCRHRLLLLLSTTIVMNYDHHTLLNKIMKHLVRADLR
jgi:hypothetical protein